METMSNADVLEIVEQLQRGSSAEKRELVVAHPESKRRGDAMTPLCQNTPAGTRRPVLSIPAAKRWRLALALAGCTLLALSTLPSPLAAQENAAPAQSDHAQAVSSPDEHERILLPAGTVISVRIADRVDSNKFHSGDLLTGIVDPSLIYNDRVVIPRGTEAHVRMGEDKKGGHLHGKAEVQLELIGLVMNGRKLEVESDTYQKNQGVLAAKVKAAGPASAGAGADMATGSGPGSGVNPVIAIFHAAKVDLQPNTRVEFTLTVPFTFVKPPAESGK